MRCAPQARERPAAGETQMRHRSSSSRRASGSIAASIAARSSARQLLEPLGEPGGALLAHRAQHARALRRERRRRRDAGRRARVRTISPAASSRSSWADIPGARDPLAVGELAAGDSGVVLDRGEQRDLPAGDAELVALAAHEAASRSSTGRSSFASARESFN